MLFLLTLRATVYIVWSMETTTEATMTLQKAIAEALAKLSSAKDPVEMLLDVWVDAEFPCSFEDFMSAVEEASY